MATIIPTAAILNIIPDSICLPFLRIPDIKRYGVNEILEDDVTVVKNFFEISMSEVFIDKPKTYTIPSNSLLWAMPINDVEIGSSNGAIQQNRYE